MANHQTLLPHTQWFIVGVGTTAVEMPTCTQLTFSLASHWSWNRALLTKTVAESSQW